MDRRKFLKFLGTVSVLAVVPIKAAKALETPKPSISVSAGSYIKDGNIYNFGPGTYILDNVRIVDSRLIGNNTTIILKNNVFLGNCVISLNNSSSIVLEGQCNYMVNNVYEGEMNISIPPRKCLKRS